MMLDVMFVCLVGIVVMVMVVIGVRYNVMLFLYKFSLIRIRVEFWCLLKMSMSRFSINMYSFVRMGMCVLIWLIRCLISGDMMVMVVLNGRIIRLVMFGV